jgi:hypothetical protein
LQRLAPFRRGRRQAEHSGALRFAELRQQLTDTAGCGVHEHFIASLHAKAVMDEIMRRQPLKQQGGGILERDVLGQRNRPLRRHRYELRIGERHVGEGDAVAWTKSRNSRTDPFDDAGPFVTENVGRLPRQMIIALTAVHVGKIKSDRLHPHDDGPLGRLRVGDAAQLQHFGSAEAVEH